jgi:DNA gyrase/topoisomerase IV subunit A
MTEDSDRAADVAADRQKVFQAFEAVLRDPHALLDLVWGSRDDGDARARIAERYGIDRGAAISVLDLQLTRLTERGRARIAEELRDIAAFLDTMPPGPTEE